MGGVSRKEAAVRRCDVCGNTRFRPESVDEVFRVEKQLVMVEHVPALICERCGEKIFDRETVERVRRAIHEEYPPSRKIVLEVLDFV
jgi:YgiT-type zinc finger domain-containing protein